MDPGIAVLPPRRHDTLVSASIGATGELVALWAHNDDEAALRAVTTEPGWVVFPAPRTDRPVPARVTRQRDATVDVTHLTAVTVAHPHLQPLPQGRLLVVGARCRWRADGPDRNAVIYGSDGRVEAQATLGDGVEHVLATTSGEVWVGYFDEGVHGAYGWGDAAAPIGGPGLVRFSAELEPAWRYPPQVDNPWGAIDDCYALNVTDDAVWTCYHSDFPLVRIHADAVRDGWRPHIGGVKAIAVNDTRVALFGGYRDRRDHLVIAELTGAAMRVTGEYQLVLPDGGPLPGDTTVIGRGEVLHLITDDTWYRLTL
ncbi:hypothetical protein ABZ541_29275 [Micromonospora sediminicola]|uniref:hypothetical protein n=1 Tax=Micromonospora sediminicola TaxID=946078 RepID=UPI0033FEEE0F